MQTEGTKNAFIDLDLNRIEDQPQASATETTADVTPTTEPTDVPTDVTEPTGDVIPTDGAPATEPEPTDTPTTEEPTEPATADEETPAEVQLARALGLADDAEKVIDKMPEGEDKDALQAIIDEQQGIIEKMSAERNDLIFSKEENQTKLKDVERLYGNIDDQPSLKQLLLYSQKAQSDETYKAKKIEVLKDMLKQEGIDIDALEAGMVNNEKEALAGAEPSGMPVSYKWGESDGGFIPLG